MNLLYNKNTSRAVIDVSPMSNNGMYFYEFTAVFTSTGFEGCLVRDMPVLRKQNFHRGTIMILLSALILGQINWKCPVIS